MKKIYSYVLFLLCLVTFSIVSVKADSCPYKQQTELNKQATNIKVVYEIEEQKLPEGYKLYANGILDPDGNDVTDEMATYHIGKYFVITITNITEDLEIQVSPSTLLDENENEVKTIKYDDTVDGMLKLKSYDIYQINNYKFDIYATSAQCSGKKIYTKNLKTPMFNEISLTDICAEHSNYEYCQEFLDSNVTPEKARAKVDAYVASLKQQNKETKSDNKIFSYIKYAIIAIVIVAGIIGLIYAIKWFRLRRHI